MKKTNEQVAGLLKMHDIMPTQQRLKIANILCAAPCHMSADQVLNSVNAESNKKVCKATVYNTLGLFADKGLIREVIVDNSKLFYDSNTSTHHHFYNVDTGELMDIREDELSVSGLPTLPEGTVSDGMEVVVRIRNR
ncbi:MAG: transcriptional repressor [Gammaproteobacteria bacterium]|nr:transcriptional repressor [Gammaproteobacteria bacterium]